MTTRDSKRMSGRAKEAARNDERILAAAKSVFLADPSAPMSAVAERAGVGISALYLRHASKTELLQGLCREGLHQYIAEARAALADERDAWSMFAQFLHRLVETNTHAITVRLAGTFEPSADLFELAQTAQELTEAVFDIVHRSGELREGVDVNDIGLLCEMLASISIGGDSRIADIRRRYLAVFLSGIRGPSPEPLPAPPPTWEEVQARWQGR